MEYTLAKYKIITWHLFGKILIFKKRINYLGGAWLE